MKSIKKNAVLNTIQTLMKIIFPLITFPYVSRILGVNELGKYNYSNSIAGYYVLCASLGIATYAVREGAQIRDDKKKIENFAKNIFSINIYSTILATIILGLCLFFIRNLNPYRSIIIILSIQAIFETLGRNWLYSIYENYLYITLRSILFQFISMILMFLFVKDRSDVMVYAGITAFSVIGNNLVNIVAGQKICKTKFTFFPELKCLIPIILIFSTSLSIIIYSNSDITILGIFGTDYNVGLYSVSVKIYCIVKQLIAAILTVSIPRFSYLIGKNLIYDYNTLFKKIFNILILILLPISVGLFMLSKECIYLLSGSDYIKASISLKILSVAMIFNLVAYMFGYCVLIPYKSEMVFFVSTLISAFINIVLNLFFIPFYMENAAAATTLIAELMNTIICFISAKKYVHFKGVFRNLVCGLIGCMWIIICCFLVSKTFKNIISRTVISVILSGIGYIVLQLIINTKELKNL
nr:flippase [uncultured Eisenbergiella sp.]